jgi:hypothetical protein
MDVVKIFDSFISGGFECGLVHHGFHDLLHSTKHTPQAKMRAHYQALSAAGIRTARDGLPPLHLISDRLAEAKLCDMQVIWDLSHYHRRDLGRNAGMVGLIANGYHSQDDDFWICPMNEPQFAPAINGDSYGDLVKEGFLNAERVAKNFKGAVKILTSNAVGDGFAIDDPFSSIADVIGINVYPHLLRRPISDVLIETHQKYGKPVMISETSWHDGFHEADEIGVCTKGGWFDHVLSEMSDAYRKGVQVAGMCWYPIVDCPPWDNPIGERWSHGLIKEDLSLDPSLSSALQQFNRAFEI